MKSLAEDAKTALDSKQFPGRPLPWCYGHPRTCTAKGVVLEYGAQKLCHSCKSKPDSGEILPHSDLFTLGDFCESEKTCFP